MSLTSILNYNNKAFKDFRDLLSDLFPKPRFQSRNQIKAEPNTTNYPLIGKAFDYLLRFNLERKYKGKVFSSQWVAESALSRFDDKFSGVIKSSEDIFECLDGDEVIRFFEEKRKSDKLFNQQVNDKFKKCKNSYTLFINFELENHVELIESTLFLGRLDDVIRIGSRAKEYIDFEPEDKLDIEDLMQLESVCDFNLFEPLNKIVLNPTFGEGSKLVGGADADIIVDDTLIDIKVTKELKLTRPYFNQLLGYYLLYLIGGIDGHKHIEIRNLGIYFARYNVLWTTKVEDIGEMEVFEKVTEFLRMQFKKTTTNKR